MFERALFLILKVYVGRHVLLNGAVRSDMENMMKAANGYEFLAISMSVAESLVSVFMAREGDCWVIAALCIALCVCVCEWIL